MTKTIKLTSIMVLAGFFSFQIFGQSDTSKIDNWAYDSIHIPVSGGSDYTNSVLVAVVDDAFRLSHKELKGFIYKNPLEISSNQYDDDGNNYADDVAGWDISDRDNDVSVPEGREKEYYHGTYISSLITRVAFLHYGEEASERVKIMPVKVLSDQSGSTYLRDGYKGIKYAMENGADIICCAWSGGNPGVEEMEIIKEAYEKGILIISSAGNFNEEKLLNPAAVPEVLSVAGVNMDMQKAVYSNFGMDVDIAAPAEAVSGAHPQKDNAYIFDDGTSAATALVAGCAAIIMSKDEELVNADVKDALVNTSLPFNSQTSSYGGKMGAGIVNLEKALQYISDPPDRNRYYSSLRPKGSIVIGRDSELQKWKISPPGSYHGFYLEADISLIKKPGKYSLSVLVNDSVWNSYNLSKMPASLFVPSPSLNILIENDAFRKNELLKMSYRGKTIDSTTLYCDGIKYLGEEKGEINDGSGQKNYSNNCSCKWIITAPMGKRIKFTFDQMDTQANIDFVYLVDGRTAIPQNFIAKFSGQNIPPVVVSQTNEVLIWFVTDKKSTGEGWQFHYEFVD